MLRLFLCSSVTSGEWGGLGMSLWRGSWYLWLFRVSWFVRLLGAKESQAMPVPLTVEAQLFLHKRKRAPEARETGGQLQTYPKLRSEIAMVMQYSVFHMQASRFSRHAALARIQTTCMVTRIYTYLVPACTSPVGFYRRFDARLVHN